MHPGRTSHHTWLKNNDLAIATLADRMATCVAMVLTLNIQVPDNPYAEELQVVRYLNGQFYHSHTDFFNPRKPSSYFQSTWLTPLLTSWMAGTGSPQPSCTSPTSKKVEKHCFPVRMTLMLDLTTI